jgi:hypothetical protein
MKMISNKRKLAEFIENKRLAELQRRGLADLRQRAAGLEARIDHDDDDLDPKTDLGPYWLRDAVTRKVIWLTGLPFAGIAEALDCLERERALPLGADIGEAWADFGKFLGK